MTSTKAGHRQWYVVDLRASELRAEGWEGPSIDRILITDTPRAKLTEIGGADCVVARIQFAEELGESNLADARLIAAAPDLLAAAIEAVEGWDDETPRQDHLDRVEAAIENLRAAISKALGEAT